VDTLPVDPAGVRLLHLGADAAPGGGDDTELPLASAIARGAVLHLNYTHPPAGRCQLTLAAGAVRDRSGNALANAQSLTFDLLVAHPGTAVWVSDADGNWNTPANWRHGRRPAQDDDVLLQRFGVSPTVTVDASGFAKSLTATLPLRWGNRANLSVLRSLEASAAVEIPTGNLGVDGPTTFEGPLTINGGQVSVAGRLETRGLLTLGGGGALTLAGASAQFAPTGGLQGANFTFRARDGAVISLPGFATYDSPEGTTFSAFGAGSRLTLPDMVTATGPVNWNIFGVPALVFEATDGGRLELPALTTLSNRVKLRADGEGGLLQAPALTRVVGTDAPFEAEIRASNNARVQVPVLTVIEHCPIVEQNGGVVERP
jgi:hypothetical protein